jgi:hypothetical protein
MPLIHPAQDRYQYETVLDAVVTLGAPQKGAKFIDLLSDC